MPKLLKKNFSFLFENSIWRIIFDSRLPLIAIELRSLADKSVALQIIDIDEFIVGHVPLEVPWLSGLAAMMDGKLILQNYKDGSLPQPQGFSLYDIRSEKTEFEETESSFAFFSRDRIVATKVSFDKIIYESIELKTGNYNKEILSESEVKKITPEEIKISLPVQYNEGSEHFNTVKSFVQRSNGKEIVSIAEYLEVNSFIIVSYYIRAKEKLDNYLMITDDNGNLLLDELLNSNMEGVGENSFFIKENQLIIIKNKKEIESYAL